MAKGLDKVLKELKAFGKEAEQIIEDETKAIAGDITEWAKQLAPKNIGKLQQSIFPAKEREMVYSINVDMDYGAYVEFGTGKKVSVPSELKDVASKFKNRGGGSFEKGLQSIKDWCRQKGIDESAAYPIFMSILNEGIQPQPFLYPSYVKGKKEYLKNLKRALKDLKNKYG